ncbi:cytochrome P450 4c3 [Condylostylus longicornis]|uniref:cytochrome P450 4c3 n=1 Tax=Condylostylus longicornis TaxID=2530218 RepID=UPI00244DEB4B|nr:cytochrome P450 4c3 [Condylostylus longicornis]
MLELASRSVLLTGLGKILTSFSPITLILITTLTIFLITYNRRRARLVKLIEKIPGPAALPFLGNSVEMQVDHDELFMRISGMQKLWGNRYGLNRTWNCTSPYVMFFKPETVEPILNSIKYVDKSQDYDYLHAWLGTGLLTSFGKKWHTRRKILTPAFHFKILDDFIDVFNEQSVILANKLDKELNSNSFNIFPYVTLCTLDIICETAMGRSIHAQDNSESEYVKAVYGIGSIIQERQMKIWLQFDSIFKLTKNYKLHQKYVEILHGFSYKVIRERKAEIQAQKEKNNNNNNNDNNNNEYDLYDDLGKKKRLAFLDLLIEASKNDTVLSNDDIREEVDTFMFEGHDTTSAAISWTLFLLGERPDVQEKVYQELYEIFGDDKERPATMKNLLDMRYLECCIKEALRLFPSVPMMARSIDEDIQVGPYTVPAGTTAIILTYMLHRNPDVFPYPEQYNPDNFLPENCVGRHPFAYIPFSAGPRNCIGQKFAILEEKCVLSTILRKYKIEAVDRREDLTLLGELILRPKDGLRVKITRRE